MRATLYLTVLVQLHLLALHWHNTTIFDYIIAAIRVDITINDTNTAIDEDNAKTSDNTRENVESSNTNELSSSSGCNSI
jgi:hypothetical protein